jgi:hypothetical protein
MIKGRHESDVHKKGPVVNRTMPRHVPWVARHGRFPAACKERYMRAECYTPCKRAIVEILPEQRKPRCVRVIVKEVVGREFEAVWRGEQDKIRLGCLDLAPCPQWR